ncbi:MAG: DUF1775 domain-containing protein [Gemmatimonadaceae bacterium]
MKMLRVFLACAALLAMPSLLFGHAVVFPKASAPGAHEKYILRVPNEKAVATTRIEIRFPGDVRVTAFADVAGWKLEVLTDSAQRIIGAVWTGSLPAQRFVELPFVAANPKTPGEIKWLTYQTYADGEKVEWTGEAGSKAPASVTVLAVPAAAAPPASTGWVSWAALGVGVLALGLALRPR